ncbi:tetratricopeptide repeat protein, partial [bacterium]|nr:tetratricopeptide repeat protein [bacterium]
KTDDSNMEYLSDGITENLINNLSRLTNLKVIARNSVFQYKNKPADPLNAGKSLNVQAVTLGNLALKDDKILIDMRMVDVRSNRNLWSGHFQTSLADIHIAQEEIAQKIAEKLDPQLSNEDRNRLTERDTENSEAYVAYLMGRYFWNERDLEKAITYFKQATVLDPDYALGYVGIASSYAMLGTSGYGKLSAWNAQAEARAAAMKTLEIKNTSPESRAAAHAALGFVLMVYDWNWQEAERQYQQSIELNANDPTTRHWYAIHLTTMGRFPEAIAQEKRALEIDPLSVHLNAGFAYNLIYARQYEQARKQCLHTLSLDSAHPQTYSYLGMIYEQRQMYDEAVASFQKAVEISKVYEPHLIAFLGHAYAMAGKTNLALKIIEELKQPQRSRPYVSAFLIGLVYAGLDEKDQAFFWFEKAYEERSNWMPCIKADPMLDNLRSDPRFATLQQRMGFPQHVQ